MENVSGDLVKLKETVFFHLRAAKVTIHATFRRLLACSLAILQDSAIVRRRLSVLMIMAGFLVVAVHKNNEDDHITQIILLVVEITRKAILIMFIITLIATIMIMFIQAMIESFIIVFIITVMERMRMMFIKVLYQ